MTALDNTHANNILDASIGTTAFTAATTGIKMRLYSVIGTAAATGTEDTGGSYTAGGTAITFAAASAQSKASNAIVSYTGMPAITTVAVELWDQAGTPLRRQWGAITSKTTNAGDTLSFASGAVTSAFT